MSTSITLQPQSLSITQTRMSSAALIAQRKAIVDVMQAVMKPTIDFGIIPGTPKPTLYKPGSEKILAMFHLSAEPSVDDLSTPDCIRYRVHIKVVHAPTGGVVGYGVGEASSAESKYQWRAVICDEEWLATPEDRRRLKWKKPYRPTDPPDCIRQVRAEMDDVANTVLKMAKKRAQIDAVLTSTAASDIFAQDLEELKAAGLDPADIDETTPQPQQPTTDGLERKPQAQPQTAPKPAAPANGAACITEPQAKRFWAVASERTHDYKAIMDYLKNVHGVNNKGQIITARYEEAMLWAEKGVISE